jgi:hypothetical protein
VKDPEASALTAVDESRAVKAALPHGLLPAGLCTSLRTAVPFTPSAGLMAAWAETLTAERARTAPERRIELKSILYDEGGSEGNEDKKVVKWN